MAIACRCGSPVAERNDILCRRCTGRYEKVLAEHMKRAELEIQQIREAERITGEDLSIVINARAEDYR